MGELFVKSVNLSWNNELIKKYKRSCQFFISILQNLAQFYRKLTTRRNIIRSYVYDLGIASVNAIIIVFVLPPKKV